MSWLKRRISGLKRQPKKDVSAGLVNQCQGCKEIVLQKELEDNFWTCPRCDHHFRIRYVRGRSNSASPAQQH